MENSKKLFTSRGPIDLATPRIMGILNLTPDSFYDGGSYLTDDRYLNQVGQMLREGADLIDIGAVSTRPGAEAISIDLELQRLLPVIENIIRNFPEAMISVDTYHSRVARESIAAGALIINDISGGRFDDEMLPLITALKIPYIMMHIQGTPRDMQKNPHYHDVVAEVKTFFEIQLNKLAALGVKNNVVVDPGFGFGKNTEHNFSLLKNLREFKALNCPVMAGVSRKSMINRVLGTSPKEALNGTTAVNTIALLNGADILRVHDVREAVEALKLVNFYKSI